MGTEPRTSTQMIEFGRLVQSVGLDAMQVYSLEQGHGHLPTGAEIRTYLIDVLSALEMPLVISTHQSVGYRIPVELLGELTERFPHAIGINCSHGDVGYLADLVDQLGGRVEIHVGGPMQALTAFALGANGYLSSEGNLAPRLCVSVVERYRAGDIAGMMDAFGRVIRLSRVLYGNGGIRMTKAVLTRLGLPGGYPRRPQLSPDEDAVRRVSEAVEALGIAEVEGFATAQPVA
jgi:4-hydroxy-tetrahydrodipicolinate synthase